MEQEVLAKIQEKAGQLFQKNPAELLPGTDFNTDLAAKSVDLVKIITVLEDEFGVDINFMEFRRKKTLGEAAAYVASLC